jgi:uncharacterized protein
MKKILLISGLAIISFLCSAQTVLWEITGKRLKKPSYLYGTIHIQDKRVFAFGDEVMEAFNNSEAYAMELLMDELDMKEVQDAMFMADNSLDKLLSPSDYKLLDSIVKEKTGQGLLMFNKMKPFFLSSQLMQIDMAKDKADALDLYLLNKARDAGKICLGIEEFSDQINAIDAIKLENQVEMLLDGLTDTVTSTEDKLEELVEAYLEGDLDKMYELTKDTALPVEFNQAFLIDRNIKMAKNIHKFIKKQSTFNAIGAAHLPGEKGVINLLRKRGYTVEPILFEWTETEE